MSLKSKPFFVTLPARGCLRLSGDDRHEFLQNLIANDIRKLSPETPLYTAMLNPQGKMIFDFFMTEEQDTIRLDCEGGERAKKLYKHMNLYKLRAKVKVEDEGDMPVYACFYEGEENSKTMNRSCFADPRHQAMGWRCFQKPQELEEKDFAEWDQRRIRLGIADGSRDFAIGKDTALECRMDKINGVSFDKGCYIGQEITVRMKLRNILRKSLHPVAFTGEPVAPFSDLKDQDDRLLGEMRSICGDIGLALLKHDALPLPESAPVKLL